MTRPYRHVLPVTATSTHASKSGSSSEQIGVHGFVKTVEHGLLLLLSSSDFFFLFYFNEKMFSFKHQRNIDGCYSKTLFIYLFNFFSLKSDK